MEVSSLRVLLDSISSFLSLPSSRKFHSNPAYKYYTKWENIAKLLNHVLANPVSSSDAASSELLSNKFEELSQSFDELRKQFESWKLLSSRIFYVLRIESLASKLRESALDLFQLMKNREQHLPRELFSPSFEECIELLKLEEVSNVIDQALLDQRESIEPTPEILVKIAESVGLRSNKEILIDIGLMFCPNTKLSSSHTTLTPNFILKSFITSWCKSNNVTPPDPLKLIPSTNPLPPLIDSPEESSGIETEVKKLVEELKNPFLDIQREAVGRIRILTRNGAKDCDVIVKCGAINMLVSHLYSTDGRIQADAVTSLYNISITDRTVIAESGAIGKLIKMFKEGLLEEARENSAATFISLTYDERNRKRVVKEGVIEPLVELLGEGSAIAKKDAASALSNLMNRKSNRVKAIEAGAVRHLVNLMDPCGGQVERAVAMLSALATVEKGTNEIAEDEEAIPKLVEVVELGSERGKEYAAAALWSVCTRDSSFCNDVIREGAIPPLVALTRSGTVRAKEKAHGLLHCFQLHKQNQRRMLS